MYVVSFPPGSGGKWQISRLGGAAPQWSRDGKEIFYVSAQPRPTLTAARVDAQGAAVRVLDIQPLFPANPTPGRSFYAVSQDGQRFLVNTMAVAQNAPVPPATVVVDWPASRSRR